jgi:tRNA pseudouridine55 synthase
MTSHDVVSCVRKAFGVKRVGHAGTLDPAAAGVLPVFLGQATRLIEYQSEADKSYRAELTLGYATDSGDDTGQIIRQSPFIMPSQQQISAVLQSFTGIIEQIPPMHSAIKIDGKKLYELARAGITVEREARLITIHNINLIHVTATTILFDVTCSKGTYIRTLCSDIGDKLGIPAVMSFLIRTRVGAFPLEHSCTLEEISKDRENIIMPPSIAIAHLPLVILDAEKSRALCNGQIIHLGDSLGLTDQVVRVHNQADIFIGICKMTSHTLIPVKIFHPESFQ